MLHPPIMQAKIMTHIKDVDNDISGDTPTLTKQTTEAFDK